MGASEPDLLLCLQQEREEDEEEAAAGSNAQPVITRTVPGPQEGPAAGQPPPKLVSRLPV